MNKQTKKLFEKRIWKILENACLCDKYDTSFEVHYRGLVDDLMQEIERASEPNYCNKLK